MVVRYSTYVCLFDYCSTYGACAAVHSTHHTLMNEVNSMMWSSCRLAVLTLGFSSLMRMLTVLDT